VVRVGADPAGDRRTLRRRRAPGLGGQSGTGDADRVRWAVGVRNPLGAVLDASVGPDDAQALVDRLDPDRASGRLAFLVRMDADALRARLPDMVAKVGACGARVVWMCDPVHGAGHFDTVLERLRAFVEVHRDLGVPAGGLHIELAAGGGAQPGQLDGHQARNLALLVGELFQAGRANTDPELSG
jgi:3-deoxy-D-arabino-heptulosonate 7-phosphate (DAHP) synthase class II